MLSMYSNNLTLAMMNSREVTCMRLIIPKNDYKIPSTVCPILYSLVRSG